MKRINNRLLLRFLPILLVFFCAAVLCGTKTQASERPTDVDEPGENCVFLALDGSFETDAQEALDRINKIRYEACNAGNVPDPRNPSRMLTPSDYVPMQWSQSLEYAARIRAAEASITIYHDRLNGGGIFGGSYNAGNFSAECLSWSYDPSMTGGVNSWYREKDDWVNQVPGTVTGHYTTLINPRYTYVGLGNFLCRTARYYGTISGAFGTFDNSSSSFYPAERDISQILEVSKNLIVDFPINLEDEVELGSEISLAVKPTFTNSIYNNKGLYVPGVTFTSSNSSVAKITSGTLIPVTQGVAWIRAYKDGELIAEKEITVIPKRCPHEFDYADTLKSDGSLELTCHLCGMKQNVRIEIILSKTRDFTQSDDWFFLRDRKIDQGSSYYYIPVMSIEGGPYTENGQVYAVWDYDKIEYDYVGGDVLRFNQTGTIDFTIHYRFSAPFVSYRLTVCEAGWKYQGGNWSYLHLGERAKGWQNIEGDWYFFGTDGYMKSGWQKDGSYWYYLDPSNGSRMVTGWKSISGKWYYFNDNGSMATGWVKVDGTWYYIDPSSSTMVTGWKKIDGSWYYFAGSGAMKTGWQKIGGTWYYLNSAMKTGWQKIDGGWYYFTSGGAMVSGWQSIGGTWYYFDPANSSKMVTGWKYMSGWYFFKDSGAMASGWQKVDGTWYYFDPANSSKMVSGKTMVIDGVSYSFAANGAWES